MIFAIEWVELWYSFAIAFVYKVHFNNETWQTISIQSGFPL
jgi:hypothetical protein